MKAVTQTTVFKKALKTILDTMTAKEQQAYDVGIGLQVNQTGGTLIMEHPVEPLIVTAEFPAELNGDAPVDCLFYLGDLAEDLKYFRKKEDIFIDSIGELVLSVEDGMFYTAELDEERIELPVPESSHAVSKEGVIQLVGIAQAITKPTFHPSSSALQVVMNKGKLFGKATNFAQLAISELALSEPTDKALAFDIPAKWLTKLRYVLERDKGTSLSVRIASQTVALSTDTTQIIMKRNASEEGINAGDIVKRLRFSSATFTFNVDEQLKRVKEQYQCLRKAEDAKADAVDTYQTVQLTVDNGVCSVAETDGQMTLYTRDLNTLLPKLEGEWEGKTSENVVKLIRSDAESKHAIYIPYQI